MNETISTLLSRRSIRKYTDQKVSQEDLDLILECGLYAASGGNHQVARFTVIENPDVLEALNTLVRSEFRKMEPDGNLYWNTAIRSSHNNPNYDFSFHAPVLILATAPAGWPNGMADCAGALQNIQVAAASLGLGACWVNQLHWLTENHALRTYLESLGISYQEEIYGSVVIGHPQLPPPKAPIRKENRITFIRS